RRRPALYVETCADLLQTEVAPLVRAIAPGSALRRGRAVTIEGDGLAAVLELPNATLAWLLGDDAIQPPLASVCELIAPTAELGALGLRRPALRLPLPRTDLDDRDRAWQAALGPLSLAALAPELAGRYVIGPGAIADVVVEATRFSAAAGTPVDANALE